MWFLFSSAFRAGRSHRAFVVFTRGYVRKLNEGFIAHHHLMGSYHTSCSFGLCCSKISWTEAINVWNWNLISSFFVCCSLMKPTRRSSANIKCLRFSMNEFFSAAKFAVCFDSAPLAFPLQNHVCLLEYQHTSDFKICTNQWVDQMGLSLFHLRSTVQYVWSWDVHVADQLLWIYKRKVFVFTIYKFYTHVFWPLVTFCSHVIFTVQCVVIGWCVKHSRLAWPGVWFVCLPGEWLHENKNPGWLLLLCVGVARVSAWPCQKLCQNGTWHVWGYQVSSIHYLCWW